LQPIRRKPEGTLERKKRGAAGGGSAKIKEPESRESERRPWPSVDHTYGRSIGKAVRRERTYKKTNYLDGKDLTRGEKITPNIQYAGKKGGSADLREPHF